MTFLIGKQLVGTKLSEMSFHKVEPKTNERNDFRAFSSEAISVNLAFRSSLKVESIKRANFSAGPSLNLEEKNKMEREERQREKGESHI